MNIDPKEYIISKGWEFKKSGSEIVTACPFCSKPEHFYIHELSGLWSCKRCGEAGNLYQLVRRQGDLDSDVVSVNTIVSDKLKHAATLLSWEKYQGNITELWADNFLVGYLQTERGLSLDTIVKFKLGVKRNKYSEKNKENIDWIMIPIVKGGELINVKYRSFPGKKKEFQRVKGCPSSLFNQDEIKKGEPIIICEGEMDAIALSDKGFTNVVSSTTGATGFESGWYDFIMSRKPPIIYICYDNDEVGKEQAKELSKRFDELSRVVLLPKGIKDATEFFVKGGTKEEFQKLLDVAATEMIDSVVTLTETIDSLMIQPVVDSKVKKLETPWDRLNYLVDDGFEAGELIVLSASPKVGKTTLALNLSYYLAKEKNVPVLFMCLEMRPERLAKKLISHALGVKAEQNNIQTMKGDIYAAFHDLPFYFSYPWNDLSIDSIGKIFTKARKRFGIQFIVFDNLHFLQRGSSNVAQEIAYNSKQFKKFAEQLEIPIMLIAQPRKLNDNIISSEDLRDTSAIKADADKIILLHRQSLLNEKPSKMILQDGSSVLGLDAALHPMTIVKVDASRYSAGGQALMWFDGALSTFREATTIEIQEYKEALTLEQERKKAHGNKPY